jgi:hypothetical protein
VRSYGRTNVHEFLGDFIVYRNLVPVDGRLPPLKAIAEGAGVEPGTIPRKSEPAYARVIARLLREARRLEGARAEIRRVAYVGDTRLNDGTAFANICSAGAWPGLAFVAAEKEGPPEMEFVPGYTEQGQSATLCLANRWSALADFDHYCQERGFAIDEATAVIVDLDKTALGARGRNDKVIDEARVEAVRRTVGGLLGAGFDAKRFQEAYELLNQPQYHAFTADNQDYLAYICLILGSGLYNLEPLERRVRAGEMAGFRQFIEEVDDRQVGLPLDLQAIHQGIVERVRAGDPTPFKAFRYNEYRTTVARMGLLADDAAVGDLLRQEILITQEVRAMALAWRAQGALLFGLSDKPDEASIPTAELAAQGFEPIHRTETHAVGGGAKDVRS